MAKLDATPYPGDWDFPAGLRGKELTAAFAKIDRQFAALTERQPRSTAKSLVGAMLRFPRGDGYAHYVVVKDKPLTLQHIPVGDAWRVEDCTLRGINVTDVRRQLRWSEFWNKEQHAKINTKRPA